MIKIKIRITPNILLRELINEHGLSYMQISKMLGVSIPGVRSWLAKPGSKNYRKMPSAMFQLLAIKCVILDHDAREQCS